MHDVHILVFSSIFKIQFITFCKKMLTLEYHTHTQLLSKTYKKHTNEMDAIS